MTNERGRIAYIEMGNFRSGFTIDSRILFRCTFKVEPREVWHVCRIHESFTEHFLIGKRFSKSPKTKRTQNYGKKGEWKRPGTTVFLVVGF